jgi:PBP1b-binding outer membrane lipoprotein LpoB
MPAIKPLIKVAAVLGLAVLLSGCVIYPAGPYDYHPPRWGYY